MMMCRVSKGSYDHGTGDGGELALWVYGQAGAVVGTKSGGVEEGYRSCA